MNCLNARPDSSGDHDLSDPLDPILFEIIQEALISVVREMRANFMRTAYSPVIYEGRDFSCVIVDASGQLVAQAEDNPSHVFPIPWSVEAMLARYGADIQPGDIFVHNDPYTGGTHLNDVALIFPVFHGSRMALFPVIRAHWGDVGGMTPGSLSGSATEVFQEGIRLPVIKAFDKGHPNEAFLEVLFSNMRIPFERRGDLDGMIGTCRVAEERLRSLIAKHGLDQVAHYVHQALSLSEKRMQRAIAQVRDGEYDYEAYLDCSGDSLEPIVVRVKLTIRGASLTVDFQGSSRQRPGPLNAGPAVAPSGAFIILKSYLDPQGPINHGAFRPIRFVNPPGTVVNAEYPFACGGFSEIRRCAESAVAGALGIALPDRITGDIKGTANHVTISGTPPGSGRTFIFYEYPAGGTGAFAGGDGNNTVRAYTEGDFSSIQSIESVEQTYPLRIRCCELRRDSGGDGRNRGGLGMRREVEILAEDATLSILSDKNIIPPFGVFGGYWGAPNRFIVRRHGARLLPGEIPGKVARFPLHKGDIVVMASSGGGGYGDPLERDWQKVSADVTDGLLSREHARERYGLIWQDGTVDLRQSKMLREQLQARRIRLMICRWDGGEHEGSRRICFIGVQTSARLGLAPGQLIELVNPKGAPLRAWIRTSDAAAENRIHLGAGSLKLLGAAENDTIEIRAIRFQEAI